MDIDVSDSPVVSVIVPVYNAGRYLSDCLRSVQNQTLRNIEIICVDDGSQDESESILRRHAGHDNRITVIRQENRGSGFARNVALGVAKGDYVSFLDADDVYPSDAVLSLLVNSCVSSGTSVAGGGVCLIDGSELTSGEKRGKPWFFPSAETVDYFEFQEDYGYQRFIYDREMLESNGILFPLYKRFQDPPFMVKALSASKKFSTVPFDTYGYRVSHKEVRWNDEKVNDLLAGIGDVLDLAIKDGYRHIVHRTLHRIDREYEKPITSSLRRGNERALEELVFLNARLFSSGYFGEFEGAKLFVPLKRLLGDTSGNGLANVREKLKSLVGSKKR